MTSIKLELSPAAVRAMRAAFTESAGVRPDLRWLVADLNTGERELSDDLNVASNAFSAAMTEVNETTRKFQLGTRTFDEVRDAQVVLVEASAHMAEVLGRRACGFPLAMTVDQALRMAEACVNAGTDDTVPQADQRYMALVALRAMAAVRSAIG